MNKLAFLFFICFLPCIACNNSDSKIKPNNSNNSKDSLSVATKTKTTDGHLKILALGDSYTVGESVCETCRFPIQLKDSLSARLNSSDVSLDIIAETGWTTTNLINAINTQNPSSDYNLVTLLIGVNNQYQHKPFEIYIKEFPVLMHKAIASVNGNKSKVIVISIPDYAFTPFGQKSSHPETISSELDQYNAWAKTYCEEHEITFVNITDITRLGVEEPEFVASDGLHPSALAYSKFVERLISISLQKIQ